jgi:hypothetical protein
MKFWLVVFLFSPEGEFLAKESYEAADKAQCMQFAGEEAIKLVNKQIQAQFHCVSDDHYNGRSIDEGIPLD